MHEIKIKKKINCEDDSCQLQRKNFAKGFSLLELIVVIAIIVIMTIVMLVSMFEDRENRELTAAGRGIAAALHDAQNNALSGLSRGKDLPCSFFVEFDNSTQYSLGGVLREPDSNCNVPLDIASYQIDYSVEKKFGNENHITKLAFAVPHGYMEVTVDNDPTNPQPFTSGNPKKIKLMKVGTSNKAFFICVYPSGQIVEEGIYKPSHTCGT